MDEGRYTLSKAFKEGYAKGMEINEANKARKIKVANRIKEERKKAGYTQESFSFATNINRITYSGYEVGRSEPTIECLVRIADVLDLSLDYICCRTDEKEKSPEKKALQEQINEIAKRLESLEGNV